MQKHLWKNKVMYRYVWTLLIFGFTCCAPQPPKVIDLRLPTQTGYAELNGLDSISSIQDLTSAICEQSTQFEKDIALRLSLNTDTIVKSGSLDDHIILNPDVYCGWGCGGNKAPSLYFFEKDVHFAGGLVNTHDDLKPFLKRYYRLGPTPGKPVPLPSPGIYRIDVQIDMDKSVTESIRLLKLLALAYSDLMRKYPKDIPALEIFLAAVPSAPPPPPPPANLLERRAEAKRDSN